MTYYKFNRKHIFNLEVKVLTKKIYEKESLIREQMTKHERKEIDNSDLVKSLSFKFLPNQ